MAKVVCSSKTTSAEHSIYLRPFSYVQRFTNIHLMTFVVVVDEFPCGCRCCQYNTARKSAYINWNRSCQQVKMAVDDMTTLYRHRPPLILILFSDWLLNTFIEQQKCPENDFINADCINENDRNTQVMRYSSVILNIDTFYSFQSWNTHRNLSTWNVFNYIKLRIVDVRLIYKRLMMHRNGS